jgi:hypothetical protein
MLALPSYGDYGNNNDNNIYKGPLTDYEVPQLMQTEPLICTDTDYVGVCLRDYIVHC